MRFTEILFPTDFSSASEAAGRVAREMAVQAGARLHVVYVVPPVAEPSLAAETLTRIARSLGDGLTVETALLSGWAGKNIVDYARDKRIDLIVLGTHGRTGVSHAILGSVAETVVWLEPCLVLTVPAACLVYGYRGDELICESCRTRIRAEALEQKREAERPARRGSSV
jgi:nucleotide-binding universal stress UspA family protein